MRALRLILFGFVVSIAPLCSAQTVRIDTPMSPPAWALLERALLDAGGDAAEEFALTYLDDRGYLECVESWGGNDGPDDAMENFGNWPLFYALGGPESVLDDYRRAWEGHLRQFSEARIEETELAKEGMFYKEFITCFDWEHTGEGLQAFIFYGLCRPDDPAYVTRLRRFARFYMDEDPEAKNYDPQHKIIRSLLNGSRGPKLGPASLHDWGGKARPGRPELLARYENSSNVQGDHPLNLIAASLAANAYMVTREPKYRDWLLEYVGAWRDRVIANGGNIPSNIGLDGTIGGEWGGQWYGGVFGWNYTVGVKDIEGTARSFTRNYVMRGPRIAFGEAFLLTGDVGYLEPLRRQISNLYSARKEEKGGRLLVPRHHGPDGWYGFTEDRREYLPIQIDLFLFSSGLSDPKFLPRDGWLGYLAGKDPEYPEKALRADLDFVRQRVQAMRADTSTPDTRRSDTPQKYSPLPTGTLVNLTLGGNDPGFRGNVVHSRLRYFDPVRRRPGLPDDVAALVEKLDDKMVAVTLVNTNAVEERSVILQAGAYGEHRIESVEIQGKEVPVGTTCLDVKLAAGAGGTISMRLKRYVGQPTLMAPWDR